MSETVPDCPPSSQNHPKARFTGCSADSPCWKLGFALYTPRYRRLSRPGIADPPNIRNPFSKVTNHLAEPIVGVSSRLDPLSRISFTLFRGSGGLSQAVLFLDS